MLGGRFMRFSRGVGVSRCSDRPSPASGRGRDSPVNDKSSSVGAVARQQEQDGLVTARLEPSASGPARKYYSLTSKGGADLDAADAEWSRLARVVNRLLEMRNERE